MAKVRYRGEFDLDEMNKQKKLRHQQHELIQVLEVHLHRKQNTQLKEKEKTDLKQPPSRRLQPLLNFRFPINKLIEWEKKYPDLHEILLSGQYLYYQGFLVLRTEKLFQQTSYGYCIQSKKLIQAPNIYCVAHTEVETLDSKGNLQVSLHFIRAEGEGLYKPIPNDDTAIIFSPPPGGPGGDDPFSIRLRAAMEGPPKVSQAELAKRTGLNTQTIYRLRNLPKWKEVQSVKCSLATIVALAVALHMMPWNSMALIRDGGYVLRENVSLERAYQLILNNYYHLSVAAANDYLQYYGFPPLTNNENIESYE